MEMLADRHVGSLMYSARQRSREGNWIASLNIYNRIIEDRPDFLPAYCELARLYLDRDDLERARDLIIKVADTRPESSEVQFLLGVIEYIEGNFEASLRHYRRVEKIDGLDCNLAMNIALVCEALGLHKDAIRHLEHALAHGEANARVYEVLADLYRVVGDYDQAAMVLERVVGKFPSDASLHYNLGLAQIQAGSYLKAEVSFQAASRLSPGDVGPLEELAGLYAKLHRLADAASVLSKLTKLDPENAQNWLKLARAYFALGDYRKSAEVLEEARQMFPDNASIPKELGYVRRKLEREGRPKRTPGSRRREAEK
jgi:tetratricopeptide (TPR) repeat protein